MEDSAQAVSVLKPWGALRPPSFAEAGRIELAVQRSFVCLESMNST